MTALFTFRFKVCFLDRRKWHWTTRAISTVINSSPKHRLTIDVAIAITVVDTNNDDDDTAV